MTTDNIHTFEVRSTWQGTRQGTGVLSGAAGNSEFAIPANLAGAGGARTNPEELLLSAVASCYSITLSLIAEKRRLPLTKVDVTASGQVERMANGGLKFISITLRPTLLLAGADEAQQSAALQAANRAEQHCVISNAIRGNVEVHVEPTLQLVAA